MRTQNICGVEHVSGLGIIGYLEERLDAAARTFVAAGYEMLSARDLAVSRRAKRSFGMVGETTHIRDAIIFCPRGPPVLVKDSPLLANLAAAASAHDRSEEFYLTVIEIAAVQAMLAEDAGKTVVQRRAMEVGTTDREAHVVTGAFADHALTQFLFEDQARSYGEYLWREHRIPAMSFHFHRPYGSDADRTFACQAVMMHRADLTTYRHSMIRSQLVWAKQREL
jgi:hypothetical protein